MPLFKDLYDRLLLLLHLKQEEPEIRDTPIDNSDLNELLEEASQPYPMFEVVEPVPTIHVGGTPLGDALLRNHLYNTQVETSSSTMKTITAEQLTEHFLSLREEANEAFASVTCLEEVEQLQVDFLGFEGRLSVLIRSFGDDESLTSAECTELVALANDVTDSLRVLVASNRATFEESEETVRRYRNPDGSGQEATEEELEVSVAAQVYAEKESWSPGASASQGDANDVDLSLPEVEDSEEHITGATAKTQAYDDTGRFSGHDLNLEEEVAAGGSALTLQHRTDLTLNRLLEHQRQDAVVISFADIEERNERARAAAREAVSELTGNQTHVYKGVVRSEDDFVLPRGATVPRETPDPIFSPKIPGSNIADALPLAEAPPDIPKPTRMQILRGGGYSYDEYELEPAPQVQAAGPPTNKGLLPNTLKNMKNKIKDDR